MGDDGETGVLCSESLRAPLTVTSTFRDPARSLCSHSQTPCQVPRFSLPSVTGTVRLEPRKQAFTWAGCKNKVGVENNLQEMYLIKQLCWGKKRAQDS